MLKNVLFRMFYISTLVVNVIYLTESYIRLEKGFVLFILKDKIYYIDCSTWDNKCCVLKKMSNFIKDN